MTVAHIAVVEYCQAYSNWTGPHIKRFSGAEYGPDGSQPPLPGHTDAGGCLYLAGDALGIFGFGF